MLVRKLRLRVSGGAFREASPRIVEEYWTAHNVSNHRRFASADESIDYFDWRNKQYLDYLELMPVNGRDDSVIVDFGCGPGHDLVGFGIYSRPRDLIGIDVSANSLNEARDRLELHGIRSELIHHDVQKGALPVPDSSVDLIHSSGVLHHMQDPLVALREFNRILKPGGRAQIMVYNYDSVWMHLYVAYQRIVIAGRNSGESLRKAFTSSTDGEDCPISNCYRPAEFLDLAVQAGLVGEFRGAAISVFEMNLLSRRWDAIADIRTPAESRAFLHDLTLDDRGLPRYRGQVAGVDGCFVFQRAQ